jgi:hypothetical protein
MPRANVRALLLLVLATWLVACQTTMKMNREELEDVGPEEGLVLGSFLVKGGKDFLGRKTWDLLAEEDDGSSFPFSTSRDYSIRGRRDGDEAVFLTKMEAGSYHFYKLVQPGFSNAEADLHVPFEVQAGKTLYLGRLVIEFPDEQVAWGTRFSIEVEDDRQACVERARTEYGLPLEDVVTGLMVVP